MSSLIVEVVRVDEVIPHPNADRMEIAVVKGWRTCISKGQMKKGDTCVYLPPDSILPIELSDRLGVTKYLAEVRDEQGERIGARVKVARLRGEPSYGLTMPVENAEWGVGTDVAEHYGITKWEPPLECTDGDAEREHPAFHKYFNLEHLSNFPDAIKEGEEVVFTEKIHGKNCRLGLIRDTKDDGTPIWRFMCGSHDVRRKELQTQRRRRTERNPDGTPVMEQVLKNVRDDKGKVVIDPESGREMVELVEQEKEWFYETTMRSQFWDALDSCNGIRGILVDLCNGQHNVVIFAEIYGSGVQDMAYGFERGQWGVRVFDITVDGKYLDVDTKFDVCKRACVPTVPILYRGPFSHEKVKEFVGGPTTICDADKVVGFKEREGIVITTVQEHPVNHPSKFFDRAALKEVNFAYLERKEGTKFH